MRFDEREIKEMYLDRWKKTSIPNSNEWIDKRMIVFFLFQRIAKWSNAEIFHFVI